MKINLDDKVRVSLSDAPEFDAIVIALYCDSLTVERIYRDGTRGKRFNILPDRIVKVY